MQVGLTRPGKGGNVGEMGAIETALNLIDELGRNEAMATARRCLEESVRDRSDRDIRFWRDVIRCLELA